ncbi:uncharacterized protein BO80DRAFT_502918 [Aspergillus ibericus CBS 121593]|uniref:Uncharacterized protein n=1 Tax=Aspergillus ibericus CBS 121593 TaxID=1448316 RepID=A0A395GXE1_9EURO|nr:hypothetical protein BO80DRAFT_502918 [Aspergillus ibericus CBS 121593]RAL00020.1 hypothetical protein BO80DRAFT_502918 [Aspergillus ibericus CBS 121593]
MKFLLPTILFLAAAVTAQPTTATATDDPVSQVLDYSDGIPLCCENHDYISEAGDDVVAQVTSAFDGDGGGSWDLGELVAGECQTAFPTGFGPGNRTDCPEDLTAIWCKKHAAWTLTINGSSIARDVHGQCHY